jgi:hypothetical protein
LAITKRRRFYGGATALLFPIDWPEPFGLVVEAMANGTPVIALRRGAVPEIVDNGVTGFIVDSVDEAVAAVSWATALDRRAIRRRFEERVSAERMAHDYVELYTELLHPIAASADLAPSRARLPDAAEPRRCEQVVSATWSEAPHQRAQSAGDSGWQRIFHLLI